MLLGRCSFYVRKIRFRISAQARSRSTDAAIFALGAGRGSRRRKGWRRSTVSPRRLPEEDGLRDQLAIAVGGGAVRTTTAALVGADAAYSDPIDTLQFCIDAIAKGRGAGE